MKRIFLLAVIAIAFTGCNKQDSAPTEVSIDLCVSFSPYTKAVMEDNGSLKWEIGDEIGIWDGKTFTKMTVDSRALTADPNTVHFPMTVLSDTKFVAVFPFDENDIISDETLQTSARRVELGSDLKSQLKAIGFASALDPNLSLKNFNSIIRFAIEDDAVKGVSFEGNNNETLLYRSRIDLKNETLGFAPESMEYKRLFLTAIQGAGTYYLGLLPGVKFQNGFTLKFFFRESMTDATLLGSSITSDPLELSGGYLLNLGTITLQPKKKDIYANCYLISAPGKYSIVPVKGNSETSVGDVASVAVLWETTNTTAKPAIGSIVKNVSFDKDSNLISYTTSSTQGNAVIAAKDASGTILWSWHIWNLLENEKTVKVGDTEALDRNIGALADKGDLSLGLMYQWGRKDPFLGGAKLDGTSLIAATANVNSKNPVASNESTGTVEYSIQNPATWIQSQAAPWNWIYGEIKSDLWAQEKTIFDPCPAGYHVPSIELWGSLTNVSFICSGRFRVNGKAFQSAPGNQTWYWLSYSPLDPDAISLSVEATGHTYVDTANRGLGSPVRCVVE